MLSESKATYLSFVWHLALRFGADGIGLRMRIFKNKAFHKWAAKEGLSDSALTAAVDEIERGLIDADLGGRVLKKRVAIANRGKRGGVRTLIAYLASDKAYFVYGFCQKRQRQYQGQ